LDIYNQVGTPITAMVPEQEEAEFILFPNPTNTYVTISLENIDGGEIIYQIIDATGRMKNSGEITENHTKIDTQALANGLYFVRIHTAKKVQTKKFIIAK
jgi:hypothetical protein